LRTSRQKVLNRSAVAPRDVFVAKELSYDYADGRGLGAACLGLHTPLVAVQRTVAQVVQMGDRNISQADKSRILIDVAHTTQDVYRRRSRERTHGLIQSAERENISVGVVTCKAGCGGAVMLGQ